MGQWFSSSFPKFSPGFPPEVSMFHPCAPGTPRSSWTTSASSAWRAPWRASSRARPTATLEAGPSCRRRRLRQCGLGLNIIIKSTSICIKLYIYTYTHIYIYATTLYSYNITCYNMILYIVIDSYSHSIDMYMYIYMWHVSLMRFIAMLICIDLTEKNSLDAGGTSSSRRYSSDRTGQGALRSAFIFWSTCVLYL